MKLVLFQRYLEYQGILGSTPAGAGSGGTSEYGKPKWNWSMQYQFSTAATVCIVILTYHVLIA